MFVISCNELLTERCCIRLNDWKAISEGTGWVVPTCARTIVEDIIRDNPHVDDKDFLKMFGQGIYGNIKVTKYVGDINSKLSKRDGVSSTDISNYGGDSEDKMIVSDGIYETVERKPNANDTSNNTSFTWTNLINDVNHEEKTIANGDNAITNDGDNVPNLPEYDNNNISIATVYSGNNASHVTNYDGDILVNVTKNVGDIAVNVTKNRDNAGNIVKSNGDNTNIQYNGGEYKGLPSSRYKSSDNLTFCLFQKPNTTVSDMTSYYFVGKYKQCTNRCPLGVCDLIPPANVIWKWTGTNIPSMQEMISICVPQRIYHIGSKCSEIGYKNMLGNILSQTKFVDQPGEGLLVQIISLYGGFFPDVTKLGEGTYLTKYLESFIEVINKSIDQLTREAKIYYKQQLQLISADIVKIVHFANSKQRRDVYEELFQLIRQKLQEIGLGLDEYRQIWFDSIQCEILTQGMR